MLKRLRSVIGPKRVIKGLILFSFVAYAWVILMLVTDLSGRFFFNRPLPASVEICDIVMPWIVFPAFAYTLALGGHIRVSLLVKRFSRRWQLWCKIFACVCGLALLVPVTYVGYIMFWESWIIKEAILAAVFVPWYAGKIIFPIGLTFFCIQYVICLAESLRELRQVVPREVREAIEFKEFG